MPIMSLTRMSERERKRAATRPPAASLAHTNEKARAIHSLAFSPDPARLAALVGPGALVWTLPGATTTPVPADRTIATHTPVPADRTIVTTTPVSKDISPVPEDIIEAPVRWDSPVLDLRDLEWSPDGRALLARAGDLAVSSCVPSGLHTARRTGPVCPRSRFCRFPRA